MSVKAEKNRVFEGGAEYAMHSLNQKGLHRSLGMEKKVFGNDRKKEKSQRRRQAESGAPPVGPVLVFERVVGHTF